MYIRTYVHASVHVRPKDVENEALKIVPSETDTHANELDTLVYTFMPHQWFMCVRIRTHVRKPSKGRPILSSQLIAYIIHNLLLDHKGSNATRALGLLHCMLRTSHAEGILHNPAYSS